MKTFVLILMSLFILPQGGFPSPSEAPAQETVPSADSTAKEESPRRYKMSDLEKSHKERSSGTIRNFLETSALLGIFFFAPHVSFHNSSGGSSINSTRKKRR